MKKIFIVLFLAMLGVHLKANNISNDTIYVFTERYEGIIWEKNYPVNLIRDTAFRWNPTKNDVEQAELLLQNFMDKQAKKAKRKGLVNQGDGCPIIHLNMNKYLRQYIGTVNNKGEKILEINCFWKEYCEKFPYWKMRLVKVLDGGSYYWSIKVNLSKKKCFDYWVNGN
jgi:hypothetical protein